MRKRTNPLYSVMLCALLAGWLTGCGNNGETDFENAGENIVSSDKLPEVYQQMLLYIREGLYEHGIEGTYQVYFSAVEDDGDLCEILLEGEEDLWMESLVYSYDQDSGWYIFEGQYEPVLAGDVFWTEYADSEFVTEMRDHYAYVCSVSGEMHFPYPMRYRAESGPIERDARVEIPYQEAYGDTSYSIWPRLYTYTDERVDTQITILYPEVSISGAYEDAEKEKMQKAVNDQIKDALFYGYYLDDGDLLNPHKKLYTEIGRSYIITRRDEDYLSMRIYEFNSARRANHPNEWETGITIDMHTGKVLRFCDVVGEGCDMDALFDSGVFRCMWFWEHDTSAHWMSHFDRRDSWDSYFYLTEDALGLITTESRYYTNIEADFEDLGIHGF